MSPCEMDGCNEGEAHDRTWTPRVQTDDLGLPGSQQKLLEAVVEANPRTVLVLINGGALGIDWAKVSSLIPSARAIIRDSLPD